MIYLYHGTDKEFDVPLPERGRRGTDFGQGFYLTPHFDSAVNMAHRVARRRNSLGSVVMCYSLDENQLVSAGLRIRSFLNIEPEWLTIKEAMRVVYSSKLYEKLQDPETGLYREGPAYLYDMLAEERGMTL